MSVLAKRLSRRVLTATVGGFAVGVWAGGLRPAAAHDDHDATPEAIAPLGQLVLRVRYVADEAARAAVNERVLADFVPGVEGFDGFGGYLIGDTIDFPDANITVTAFEPGADLEVFQEQVVVPFVASLGDLFDPTRGDEWSGDVLIGASPGSDLATPEPVWPLRSGYAAARLYTSNPGTDPRDFVPLVIDEFLPLITVLEGFKGYLWFPFEGGWSAISLYDSEASAAASTEAAFAFVAEHLSTYSAGDPVVYNASIVYANFPLLG